MTSNVTNISCSIIRINSYSIIRSCIYSNCSNDMCSISAVMISQFWLREMQFDHPPGIENSKTSKDGCGWTDDSDAVELH